MSQEFVRIILLNIVVVVVVVVVVVEAHLSRAEVVAEAWQGVEPANLAVEAPAGRQARH